MLESVIRANKKYYSQTFLEECKWIIKKNKMDSLNDDLDLSSFYNESGNESDTESDNGSDVSDE